MQNDKRQLTLLTEHQAKFISVMRAEEAEAAEQIRELEAEVRFICPRRPARNV